MFPSGAMQFYLSAESSGILLKDDHTFTPEFVTTGILSRLIGEHQASNAETAVAAAVQLKRQGFQQITDRSMAEGLAAASLTGRFQVGPFVPLA